MFLGDAWLLALKGSKGIGTSIHDLWLDETQTSRSAKPRLDHIDTSHYKSAVAKDWSAIHEVNLRHAIKRSMHISGFSYEVQKRFPSEGLSGTTSEVSENSPHEHLSCRLEPPLHSPTQTIRKTFSKRFSNVRVKNSITIFTRKFHFEYRPLRPLHGRFLCGECWKILTRSVI